jgi:hypothetical protein
MLARRGLVKTHANQPKIHISNINSRLAFSPGAHPTGLHRRRLRKQFAFGRVLGRPLAVHGVVGVRSTAVLRRLHCDRRSGQHALRHGAPLGLRSRCLTKRALAQLQRVAPRGGQTTGCHAVRA